MVTELAEIHVEDVKAGYVLHHPEHGVRIVAADAWPTYSLQTGEPVVDLCLSLVEATPGHLHEWVTFPGGTVVEVEA
jgi:hypothetical protein